jgi:hypothetical protein
MNADIAHNTVETMSANKIINKVLEISFVELHGICYAFQASISATMCQLVCSVPRLAIPSGIGRRLCRFFELIEP